MDSPRAAKRRKLDTSGDETKTVLPSRVERASATYSEKFAAGDRHEAVGSIPKMTSREAWAAAKSKRLAESNRRAPTERELYDDIDGAHPSPKRQGTSTGKRKTQALDPLRNQRNESASSPTKKTSLKGVAPLGFFKQFHTPQVQTTSAVSEVADKVPKRVSGGGRHDTPITDAAAGTIALGSAIKTLNDVQLQTVGTVSSFERKTFEDEIREVEEAARKEAGTEGANTPRAQSAKRRSVTRAVARPEKTKTVEVKIRKTAVKRKGSRAVDIQPQPEHIATAEEPVEIDETIDVAPSSVVKRKGNRAGDIQPQPEYIATAEEPMEIDETIGVAPSYAARKAAVVRTLITNPALNSLHAPEPTEVSHTQSLFDGDQLQAIKAVLLQRQTGKRPMTLTNLDGEYAKVSQLVGQTVTAGESNSMLLIGARGSGKTALVNQVLSEQTIEHPEDFHVVRLNGLIHTDDKIALREIWRQLGREMQLDDDDGTARNYADTLTTLLALLSHPAEQGRDRPYQVTKSVIFILDEFDLFAGHPRQTLLYNLFDIAQSRKAPIAVLGLTTRVDVAESLEKRVKSRFSHRYVHLSLAKSFPAFRATCKAAMLLHSEDVPGGGEKALQWNSILEDLLEAIADRIRRIYHTTKSIPEFLTRMIPATATLPTHMDIDSESLVEHFARNLSTASLNPPDSKLALPNSLSTLQLALLICAARQTAIHNTEVVSFALVYDEYKVLASKAKLQASAQGASAQGAGARISGKDVAMDAWGSLVEMGLVLEDGRAGGGGGRVDVGLEELGASGVDLGGWGRWCREI